MFTSGEHCDAKHLSPSCQRKSIDFSLLFVDLLPLWDLREKQNYQTSLAVEASQQPIVQKNQSINMILFLATKTGLSRLFKN